MKLERIYETLGEKISNERLRRNLTQLEFCNFLLPTVKLARSSLAKIEMGKQRFMLHDLFLICEKLGWKCEVNIGKK